VVAALATLPTVERVTWARLRLTFGYDAVSVVQQLAAAHGARVADEAYAADVTYAVDVPASAADALAAAVRDATRGRASVERADA
jgi:putative IMPACT (imprinted ancient) family translation regulator